MKASEGTKSEVAKSLVIVYTGLHCLLSYSIGPFCGAPSLNTCAAHNMYTVYILKPSKIVLYPFDQPFVETLV
jgi:hypothetical protein